MKSLFGEDLPDFPPPKTGKRKHAHPDRPAGPSLRPLPALLPRHLPRPHAPQVRPSPSRLDTRPRHRHQMARRRLPLLLPKH